MPFIKGTNRYQSYFSSLKEQVGPDNQVRLMDAFVDKLELEKLGFCKPVYQSEGRQLHLSPRSYTNITWHLA